MGWFDKKKSQKKELSENIELIIEIFTKGHNSICDSLNECFAKIDVFGKKISLKIEKSSKLEIGLYLLFRLDQRMCGKQNEDARQVLFETCMHSMLPSNEDRFIDLAYHRSEVYGGIFNRVKNSGGDWGDCRLQCNDWLINAMLYSNNDYNKMTTDDIPLVIIGFREHSSIKLATSSFESTGFLLFDSCFKYVFENNHDFRLLPAKELISRINTGQKEGYSIIDKQRGRA